MMSATPEERAALAKEIEARAKENKESIKTFLNSDEDYADASPATRTACRNASSSMASAPRLPPSDDAARPGVAEGQAWSRPCTRPGPPRRRPNFTGPDAFTKMTDGDLAGELREELGHPGSRRSSKEVGGILDETQMSAFKEYREPAEGDAAHEHRRCAEKMMSRRNRRAE